MSLPEYSGSWEATEAAYLLRRTVLGATLDQINEITQAGLQYSTSTLYLLYFDPILDFPYAFLPEETITPYGQTWVNKVYPSDQQSRIDHENARKDSLEAWLFERLNNSELNIRNKMMLFLHNHFAVKFSPDSRATFDYFKLLFDYSVGNFKELVKKMTINPSMLLFLDGAYNTQGSPNENYAREFLELFTIGKGPQIGEGDYSNYTEDDVRAVAKAFTGWKVQGILSDSEPSVTSYFEENDHEQGDKVLSYHFNNSVITYNGSLEYSDVIDIIFEQKETARFICRKLYRWFVNADIDTYVEENIISVMTDTLYDNNYEIWSVLIELFRSEHFYQPEFRGAIIKNPFELIFSQFNSLGSKPPFDFEASYNKYLTISLSSTSMGANILIPHSVSGWPAYYQAPQFYKLWINSSLIKTRLDFSRKITVGEGVVDLFDQAYEVDYLTFLNSLSLPSDPVQIINDLSLIFCSIDLDQTKKEILKSILTDGLPDFEWTVQYNEYQQNPDDPVFSNPIKEKVTQTLLQLFKFPDFQVI